MIESKQNLLLESLNTFYDTPRNFLEFQHVIKNETGISLRILDWLVTNFSKKKNVVYASHTSSPPRSSVFNIFVEYKSQLKGYSKRFFDPFCRRERLEFRGVSTTLGQLNFFRWAISNGVLEYGRAHNEEIEADMMASIRHRLLAGSDKPNKRKELSKAAVKTCTKTHVKTTVSFE